MLEKFDHLEIVNVDLKTQPKTIKERAEHLRGFDFDIKSSFDFIVTWRDRFTVHVPSKFSTCALYQIDSKDFVDRSQPILFGAAAAAGDLLEAITTIAEAMCYSAIESPSQVRQSTLDDKMGCDINAVKTYLSKYPRVYKSCFEVLHQKIKDLERDPDWTELETKLLTTMVNAHEINLVFDHQVSYFPKLKHVSFTDFNSNMEPLGSRVGCKHERSVCPAHGPCELFKDWTCVMHEGVDWSNDLGRPIGVWNEILQVWDGTFGISSGSTLSLQWNYSTHDSHRLSCTVILLRSPVTRCANLFVLLTANRSSALVYHLPQTSILEPFKVVMPVGHDLSPPLFPQEGFNPSVVYHNTWGCSELTNDVNAIPLLTSHESLNLVLPAALLHFKDATKLKSWSSFKSNHWDWIANSTRRGGCSGQVTRSIVSDLRRDIAEEPHLQFHDSSALLSINMAVSDCMSGRSNTNNSWLWQIIRSQNAKNSVEPIYWHTRSSQS